MNKTFEEAVKQLEAWGVEYDQDDEWIPAKPGPEGRHQVDVPVFTGLRLPFTPDEWCNLCMSEGAYYIGGCCGDSSEIQDVVEHVFRIGSGRIDYKKLEEIAERMTSHDGDESPFCTEPSMPLSLEEFNVLSPWDKMARLWHTVKGHGKINYPVAPHKDYPPVQHALWELNKNLWWFGVHNMFKREDEPNPQEQGNLSWHLAHLLPALKTVNEAVHTLAPLPWEGCVLIEKGETKSPEAIASNGYGLCLFKTEEDARTLLKQWKETEEKYENPNHRGKVEDLFGIRPVRITVEDGLVFLDNGFTKEQDITPLSWDEEDQALADADGGDTGLAEFLDDDNG